MQARAGESGVRQVNDKSLGCRGCCVSYTMKYTSSPLPANTRRAHTPTVLEDARESRESKREWHPATKGEIEADTAVVSRTEEVGPRRKGRTTKLMASLAEAQNKGKDK